jgi:hypothetical protein
VVDSEITYIPDSRFIGDEAPEAILFNPGRFPSVCSMKKVLADKIATRLRTHVAFRGIFFLTMNDFTIYRSRAYGVMSEINAVSTFVRGIRSSSTSSDTRRGWSAGAATRSR